jgi:hypothetical protein
MSLALSRPRMVIPGADYPQRVSDGILVLQRGENASTDYYLRARLQSSGLRSEIADLTQDPGQSALMARGGPEALTVIFCRYASPAWLEALEAARDRFTRVVFFMDDDLPAMMRASDIPSAARGKVALHFAAYADRLGALCSEVWVSTAELARRYPDARARILGPLPEVEPPAAAPAGADLVVYHGTDVHDRERRFTLEVARLLEAGSPGALIEVAGDKPLERRAATSENVRIVPQLAWPDYLAAQAGRTAAISLAPLYPSQLNDARAHVKAFDAARLGAAGVFADAPAYRGQVRHGEDGLLLPMQPAAWAEAIAALLADPARRARLAETARGRLTAALRSDEGFPPARAG